MQEYVINSKKYGKQIVLLDDDDYEMIVSKNISVHLRYDKTINGFYAQIKTYPLGCTKKNGKDVRSTTPLHRWIVSCPKDKVVDHINRNTLDNRKCNLRICTQRENNCNKRNNTKHIGVRKINNRYYARAVVNGKEISLGGYASLDEAIIARNDRLSSIEGGDDNVLL